MSLLLMTNKWGLQREYCLSSSIFYFWEARTLAHGSIFLERTPFPVTQKPLMDSLVYPMPFLQMRKAWELIQVMGPHNGPQVSAILKA